MGKNFLRRIASMLLLAALFVSFCVGHGPSVPILTYHNLTDDPLAVNDMTITAARFREDMEYLQREGYTALLPADLLSIRAGRMRLPEKPIMITFDDGYRSNYDLAYPILQETGMRAAISVVASIIRTFDEPGRMMLTWAELREMSESGIFEIGSHTYNLHNADSGGLYVVGGPNGIHHRKGEDHTTYILRVGGDLWASIELIRRNTGQTVVNYFAFPFGESDRWAPVLLERLGLSVSVLVKSGSAKLSRGLHNMPRLSVRMDTPLPQLLT